MGGEIVGLTADSQAHADAAKAEWGIDFPLVADPSCQLVTVLNEKGWITSVIERTTDSAFSEDFTRAQLGMTFQVGMLQPGVVALRGAVDDATVGNDDTMGWDTVTVDPEILLTWGLVPTAANINGATNRLNPSTAVAAVRRSLSGDLSLARPPIEQGKGSRYPIDNPSLPLFYMLLMANGNFIHPRAFAQTPDGSGDVTAMTKSAMTKLVAAATAVGCSLYVAPTVTAAGIVVYALWIIRPGGPWELLSTRWQPRPPSKL